MCFESKGGRGDGGGGDGGVLKVKVVGMVVTMEKF